MASFAHAARLLDLAEHDVLIGAVQCFPFRHAPLQRAPERLPDPICMTPRQFIEQADRASAAGGLEQRDDLLVPQVSQRIGAGAVASPLFFPLGKWGSLSVRLPVAMNSPALAEDMVYVWWVRTRM